jgi:hypothetical protein
MRVHPTHYTISALYLKSWVIEGSPDGENWTEIDRQTDNEDFSAPARASFAVSTPVEWRFIRMTEAGKGVDGRGYQVYDIEFFGTLCFVQ